MISRGTLPAIVRPATMLDSQKADTMADEQADDKRPVTIEDKIDALSNAVRHGFAAIDQHFVSVDQHFVSVDQHFISIDQHFISIDQRFVAVHQRFVAVDQHFAAVDQHFAAVDQHFAAIDERFVTLSRSIDQRFAAVDAAFVEQREYTEFAFERLSTDMQGAFGEVYSRFDRLERKLDGFIDTQSKTNELVARRLDALEGPSGGRT